MNTTTEALLAFALAFAGMAASGFAMDRHHEQLTQRRETPPVQRRLLRCLGSLLIAFALATCLIAWGGSVGTVVWLGFLSVSALSVALLMPYWPRAAATAAALSAVVGVAGLCCWLVWPSIHV